MEQVDESGPWACSWFDESPRGATFGVRRADEVLCYTSPNTTGHADAITIAQAINHFGGDVPPPT